MPHIAGLGDVYSAMKPSSLLKERPENQRTSAPFGCGIFETQKSVAPPHSWGSGASALASTVGGNKVAQGGQRVGVFVCLSQKSVA